MEVKAVGQTDKMNLKFHKAYLCIAIAQKSKRLAKQKEK